MARRQAVLEEAVAEIRADGGIAAYHEADIGDRDQLNAAVDAAEG